MENEELLWKQYELHINLYRSYLELALKMNVFYYAITGAILSYYFTHKTEALVEYSLVLPFLMSLTFGFFLLYGARLSRVTSGELKRISSLLHINVTPETKILEYLLYIFGVFMLLASFVLEYLLLYFKVTH